MFCPGKKMNQHACTFGVITTEGEYLKESFQFHETLKGPSAHFALWVGNLNFSVRPCYPGYTTRHTLLLLVVRSPALGFCSFDTCAILLFVAFSFARFLCLRKNCNFSDSISSVQIFVEVHWNMQSMCSAFSWTSEGVIHGSAHVFNGYMGQPLLPTFHYGHCVHKAGMDDCCAHACLHFVHFNTLSELSE